MDYYIEKTIEYRLADSRRTLRNVDFARKVRELERQPRPRFRPSLTSRFIDLIPRRVSKNPCDGGAV